MIPESVRVAVLAQTPEETALLAEMLDAAGLRPQRYDTLPSLLADSSRCDLALIALSALGHTPHRTLANLRAASEQKLPLLLIADAPVDENLLASLLDEDDDYLLKPVRRAELVTRLRVQAKRAWPHHPAWSGIELDGFIFDPHLLCATTGTRTVELTHKEFELALLLLQNLGRPLSRAYLLERLWPEDAGQASRTLDTHVSRVRNKLGLRPENGYRLSPVYSFGYLLERLAPAAADG